MTNKCINICVRCVCWCLPKKSRVSSMPAWLSVSHIYISIHMTFLHAMIAFRTCSLAPNSKLLLIFIIYSYMKYWSVYMFDCIYTTMFNIVSYISLSHNHHQRSVYTASLSSEQSSISMRTTSSVRPGGPQTKATVEAVSTTPCTCWCGERTGAVCESSFWVCLVLEPVLVLVMVLELMLGLGLA